MAQEFTDRLNSIFAEAMNKVVAHARTGENSVQKPLEMYPHGILIDLSFMVYHKASRVLGYSNQLQRNLIPDEFNSENLNTAAALRDDLIDLVNYAGFLVIGLDDLIERKIP